MVTTDDSDLHLCVEVVVGDDGSWIDQLPPAPATGRVTVSFDDIELAARDRTAVSELGYLVVGTAAARHVEDVAHLLVPMTTVHRHERWWRAMIDLANKIYDLRFGPVQMVLADVLEVHADARRTVPSVSPRSRLRDPNQQHPTA